MWILFTGSGSSTYYFSSNTTTWVTRTFPGFGLGAVVWNPVAQLFDAATGTIDGRSGLYSADGSNWTLVSISGLPHPDNSGLMAQGGAWNPSNGIIFYPGNSGYLDGAKTTDGVTFTKVSAGNLTPGVLTDPTKGIGMFWIQTLTGGTVGRWVGIGNSGYFLYNTDNTFATAWTTLTTTYGYARGIATNGSNVVIVGSTGLAYTTDYSTYTAISGPPGSTYYVGNLLTWNGSVYIYTAAVSGSNDLVYTSPNGITWTARTPNGLGSAFTVGGNYLTYSGGNTTFNFSSGAGAASTALDINGGLTIRNGFRPLYALVTGTSLTGGTTPSITTLNYGTYFNITNSGFNTLTLPTSTYSTDSNAFWVLRNNTSTYLSITTTYTGTGGGGSATLTIPPANSTTIMFTSNTSGSNAYTFF
jgi:hypothetical protein